MTGDAAAFLTRPDLPDGFERWAMELPGRTTRPTTPDEWAGALVLIESGTLEVGCEAGGTRTFHAGDMLALGWLPLVELRNHGDEPVRIVSVRRREAARPTDSYLRVTRPDA